MLPKYLRFGIIAAAVGGSCFAARQYMFQTEMQSRSARIAAHKQMKGNNRTYYFVDQEKPVASSSTHA